MGMGVVPAPSTSAWFLVILNGCDLNLVQSNLISRPKLWQTKNLVLKSERVKAYQTEYGSCEFNSCDPNEKLIHSGIAGNSRTESANQEPRIRDLKHHPSHPNRKRGRQKGIGTKVTEIVQK